MITIIRTCPVCAFTELATVQDKEVPSNYCRKCWKKHGKAVPTRSKPATEDEKKVFA